MLNSAELNQNQISSQTIKNLKEKFLNRTTIFIYIAFSLQLIYAVVLGVYLSNLYTKTNGMVIYAFCLLFMICNIAFVFFIKDEKQKMIFVKYLVIMCFANNIPIFFVSYFDSLYNNTNINGSLVMSSRHVAEMLIPHTFCGICMYLGFYLGFAKNKRNAAYGISTHFYVFTGFLGSIICTCLYLPIYVKFNLNPAAIDFRSNAFYDLFNNFFTHYQIVIITLILFREKLIKFSVANVIWLTSFVAILIGFGYFNNAMFTINGNTDPFNNQPGFYINTSMLGSKDKIFKYYTLIPGMLLLSLTIALYFEFKKFPKEERFYKKFNIFNTYYKTV